MQHASGASGTFSRAPLLSALKAFFVDEREYLRLALSHVMAVNLEAPDLMKKHQAGEYPIPGWEAEVEGYARQGLLELRAALRRSFMQLLLVVLLAAAVVWAAGGISISMPVSWPKLLSLVGGFLAAWATLFALGRMWRSRGGEALHEILQPQLFKVLFIAGTFMATVGQLW